MFKTESLRTILKDEAPSQPDLFRGQFVMLTLLRHINE